MKNNKKSSVALYCKLIGIRLLLALRLVSLLAVGVTAIARLCEMINLYINFKTVPTASDLVILLAAVILQWPVCP